MATKDDILTAITNASNGFKIWSETPLFQRITILQEFLKLYWKHSDELVDLLIKEVGKTVRNATLCVRGRGNFIDECIAQARTLHGECFAVSNRIGTNGDLVTTIREPVGIEAYYAFQLPDQYGCKQGNPCTSYGQCSYRETSERDAAFQYPSVNYY